jgi:uncharacterized protein (UPF0335 family)
MSNSPLLSIVERVERLEGEIKELNADKSDVYAEAKANGYDVKVIKAVVAARRKEPAERADADALFDLYWTEIHGSPRARAREGDQ